LSFGDESATFWEVQIAAVLAFLALASLGSLIVLWARKLDLAYGFRYLAPFSLHVAFWNVQALVQVTQYILGNIFLTPEAAGSQAQVLWPMYALFLVLSLYFLFVTIAELRGRTLSTAARISYLVLGAALMAAQAVLLYGRSQGGPTPLPGALSLPAFLLKNGTILGCLLWMILPAGGGDDLSERRFRRRFAVCYLAGYGIFQLSATGTIPLDILPYGQYLIALIQIGFELPLLVLLSSHLKEQSVRRPPAAVWAGLEKGMEPLGLSPREAEIVGLVLHGYSNREIGKRLYISLETVKKHVSNVYRKLGVRNRVQLSNLVQNRCRIAPGE
jgi:DNA-binding CsgD family transcriptional regulator